MFSCLRRYDEAGKDYDAILQDDPTNTVSPRKEKGKTPSSRLGPAVALLWKAFEICRDASVAVAAAARVRLPLASPTSTAVLISPSTAQMKSVSGGGRWELIHGFTSVTDMLEVKRKWRSGLWRRWCNGSFRWSPRHPRCRISCEQWIQSSPKTFIPRVISFQCGTTSLWLHSQMRAWRVISWSQPPTQNTILPRVNWFQKATWPRKKINLWRVLKKKKAKKNKP